MCKNCGKCCQKVIYVSLIEFEKIAKHLLSKSDDVLKIQQKQVSYRNSMALFCDMRDDINNNCIVYDVLPSVCLCDCENQVDIPKDDRRIALHNSLIFKDENVKENILKMCDLFKIKVGD